MGGFSIDLQYQLAVATVEFERLLYIDEVWTRAVAGKASVPAEDMRTLQAITDEMALLLDTAGGHARRLRVWLELDPDLFEEAWTQGFARLPLDDEVRQALQETIGVRGGFVPYTRQCIAGLLQSIPAEREQIADQFGHVVQGLPATGDLSERFRCYLVGIAFSSAVGAMFVSPFAITGAIMSGLYLQQRCWAP